MEYPAGLYDFENPYTRECVKDFLKKYCNREIIKLEDVQKQDELRQILLSVCSSIDASKGHINIKPYIDNVINRFRAVIRR